MQKQKTKPFKKGSFLARKKIFLLPFLLLLAPSCVGFVKNPAGNPSVPEPAKAVDIQRYLGRWYEIARYDARFQKGCDYVTADYSLRPDGRIRVVNACRRQGATGPLSSIEGHARVVQGSHNAKLRVTFFWPFYGNYWILDRGAAYEWAIVGESSGRYLWLLSRNAHPSVEIVQQLKDRAAQMGYDLRGLRITQQ